MAWDEAPFLEAGEKLRGLLKEVKRVIVGQDRLLERMLVALPRPPQEKDPLKVLLTGGA
jgi:hypothetical protein